MINLFQAMLLLLLEACRARRDKQIRFLKLQLSLMRKHLGKQNIILSPDERMELMDAGKQLEHNIDDILEITSVQTYRRWLKLNAKGIILRKVGRKPSSKATVEVVLRLARENAQWGYRRLAGELKKLGITLGKTTISDILRRNGLPPSSRRTGKSTWGAFVTAHLETMIAADFFCKKAFTWRGWVDAYVFAVIHLGSRKVYLSPATFHPNSDWLRQQVRNVSIWSQDEGITAKYLILDNDAKYSKAFDNTCRLHGLKVLRTPVRTPEANAYCESFIGKTKRECLNHFLCFGLKHLDHLLREWSHYYHICRPHQGKENNVLVPESPVSTKEGAVMRHRYLGGLLNHYYRDAA